MPKKTKAPEPFTLDFTGKMTILVELDGHGPMQWRVNDKDFVMKVVRLIINELGNPVTIDGYDKREEKKLQKMMDEIQ